MASGPKSTKTTMIACLNYRDADKAVDWLCKAFGFEQHAVYRDNEGKVVHAELGFGNGMIMLGPEDKGDFGKRFMTSPEAAGGRCTQTVYAIVDDADAHHAVAIAHGAEVVMPLKNEDYGGRGYAARDPEGHFWTFGTYDPFAARPA
jgi:uncharacterized glyoxalase superfamily protein PhnB